jgi:hypothetical protein
MDIQQILKEIDELPIHKQLEVFAHLASKLKKREQVLSALEKIRGKGMGLWNIDAQEHVNILRKDDRF